MLQDHPPDASASADRAAATPPTGVIIRPMEPADADQVLAVYQAGLDTGQASFETAAPDWEASTRRSSPGTGSPPPMLTGGCSAGSPPPRSRPSACMPG
jgi:hypothetical protein